MSKIHLLDQNTINMIAAGEVVERPASVVKELVENSIDAEASRIIVTVKNGGIDEISVSDDGSGMSAADAQLAFTQHATSKIQDASDLDKIFSLGFRGEALASISSVSRVELDTYDADKIATRVEVEQSIVVQKDSHRTVQGTHIVVKNLFQNVPARRKFLRSAATEFNHLHETFISLALVNLNIHLELHHNDKLIYRLPKTTDFRERILGIWSSTIAEGLYSGTTQIPGGSITIYIGKPELGRKDRKLEYLFINKRYITDRALHRAVIDGFSGFLPLGLYPVYFVMLELDPTQVDVNVHPRKLEVRLDNSSQLFQAIKHLVAKTLDEQTKSDILTRISGQTDPSSHQPTTQTFSHSTNLPIRQPANSTRNPINHLAIQPSNYSTGRAIGFTHALLSDNHGLIANSLTSQLANYSTIQLFNTYITYENGDEIVFVDQHAAAEKILYEKLRKHRDHTRTRPLLTPQVIEMSSSDKQKALAHQEDLTKLGIEIEDFGGQAIQITALPELTPQLDVEKFIQELGERDSETGDEQAAAEIGREAHLLIATLACHGSIRAGQKLNQLEMQQLLTDLAKCDSPYNCPHGRPVSWAMKKSELEKNFKRII